MPQSASADKVGDFYFIEANEPAAIIDRMIALVRDRIPTRFGLDAFRDVQVLTPMNRFELGSRALNAKLQEVLNPPQDGPEVARFGWSFRVGDKVLQTRNNYDKDVFNGDIGQVSKIDLVESEVTIQFDTRQVVYDFGELDEVSLAYAITIHKSQGSEFPAVVIPMATQHFMLLQRNLVYTGMTRGRRLVVLVGQRKALAMAVRNDRTQQRFSALQARLRLAQLE